MSRTGSTRCATCGDRLRASVVEGGGMVHALPGRLGLAELPYDHDAKLPTARVATDPAAATIEAFRAEVWTAVRGRTPTAGRVDALMTEFVDTLAALSAVEIAGARAAVRWVEAGTARIGFDEGGDFVRIEFSEPTIVEAYSAD